MSRKRSTAALARRPAPATARFADVILDSVADGVFTVDLDWRITSFNRAAAEITGVPRDLALGRPCHEVFRASVCKDSCFLRRTLDTERSLVNRAAYIVRPDGRSVPIGISTAVLQDDDGAVVGGVETFRDLSAIRRVRQEQISGNVFRDIISRNHRMREIFRLLPDVARSGSTVLIRGPSGSGKELVAKAIHDLSPRANGPLVTVNCGALPDALLESELFGYRAGAFTDARRDKPGRFALAGGGTLFLDEIGDVSPALQTRLLRVLQERTYEPLGDTRTRRADVRIVAATHRDLAALMARGVFRDDLYYRLSVIELELPALRDRPEDVPLLARHFLQRLCRLHDREIVDIAPEAMVALVSHDYPGNVRELQNIIEYAFIICRGGMLQPEHFRSRLERQGHEEATVGRADGPAGGTLAALSEQLIRQALERNGYHRQRTARELGISKTTLWRRMKQLGITPPAAKPSEDEPG